MVQVFARFARGCAGVAGLIGIALTPMVASADSVPVDEIREETTREMSERMVWHLCAPNAASDIYAAQKTSPDALAVAMIYHASGDPGCPVALWMQGMVLLEQDKYARAVALLKKAARLGSANATLMMGSIYTVGEATRQDPIEAYKWYALAAESGLAVAAKGKDHLAQLGLMTPEDIAEAERRMEIWVARLPEPRQSTPSITTKNALAALKQLEIVRMAQDSELLSVALAEERRAEILDDLRAGETIRDYFNEVRAVVNPAEEGAPQWAGDRYGSCRAAGMEPGDCDAQLKRDGWEPDHIACWSAAFTLDESQKGGWEPSWNLRHRNDTCGAEGYPYYNGPG